MRIRALSPGAVAVSFAFAMGLLPSAAHAEDPAITVQAELEPTALGAGETGKLALSIGVPDGWHLWGLDPGPGPLALTLRWGDGAALSWVGEWSGDKPVMIFDRGFDRELAQYVSPKVRLERGVKVDPAALAGERTADLLVRGQICTEEQCIEQRMTLTVRFTVAGFATGAPAPSLYGQTLSVRASGSVTGSVSAPPSASGNSLADARARGFFAFVFLAFLAGLGALATPCVFPAIPLTVSFFSKYSEENFGRSARLAAVYSGTMVAAFTGVGVLVSVLFGATKVQDFASHPLFNLILAATLVFFALNLLGLFEIRTPQFLMTGANKLEAKFGRSARLAKGGSGGSLGDYVVVSVAALTATTVFFTCTVAFVSLVLVAAADGEWFWPTVGMLAFSSAFALPFFFLAMFPGMARRLQGQSGGWLNATRVTLGFLELAAALKFFSNADLVWKWGLLSRELVLSVWVPLFVLCGMFLLGKLKIGIESTERPDGGVSVIQVLASAAVFSLALFLAVGLFNKKPFGGWIDGWLPPVVYPSSSGAVASSGGGSEQEITWIHDLAEGRKRAASEGRLVFVNYTGYTCTNCRYMEGGVFPRPEIRSLLETMVRVELYTDGGEAEHEKSRADQLTRFKTVALPFYTVERADGTVIATFPSSTNDPDEFRRFLADAMEKAKKTLAPAAQKVAADGRLILSTTGLASGAPAASLVPGKWNLVNFWATWCGPCRTELEGFMAKMGKDLEARGGRFVTVAVEEDESTAEALAFMKKVGVPDASALRVPSDADASVIDSRFGFSGNLPVTVLVSPEGKVVWRHAEAITKEELSRVLIEHTGYASL